MSPSGTLVSYKNTLELVLFLHRGLGFSLIESFLFAIYFLHLFLSQTIQPKTPKLLLYYLGFLVDFANQYLQILVGSTTFLIEKYYN
jgi:hypothetical protein